LGANSRSGFWPFFATLLVLAPISLLVPPASAEIIEVTGKGKSADWNWSKGIVEGSATSDAQWRAKRQCKKQGGEPTSPVEYQTGNCTCKSRNGTRIINDAAVKALEYSCACTVTIDCRLGGLGANLREKLAILKLFGNEIIQTWEDTSRTWLRFTYIKRPWPALFADTVDRIYGFQDRFRQFRDDILAIQEPNITQVYIEKMEIFKVDLEDDWETLHARWNSEEIQGFINRSTSVLPPEPTTTEKDTAKKDAFADELEKELMQVTGADEDKKANKEKVTAPNAARRKQNTTDPLEQALMDATHDSQTSGPTTSDKRQTPTLSPEPKYGLSVAQWAQVRKERTADFTDAEEARQQDESTCWEGSPDRPSEPVEMAIHLTAVREWTEAEKAEAEAETRKRKRREREQYEDALRDYNRDHAQWEREKDHCLAGLENRHQDRLDAVKRKHAEDDKRLSETEALNKDLLGN
jgi:hypothetical protein